MAYTKTTWQNSPSTATPINATNLNNIENGIKTNDNKLLGTAPAGNMVVESIRSKNLFNVNTCVGGNLDNGEVVGNLAVNISSTNAETATIVFTSSQAWRGIVSDYIEVDEGEQYILNYTRSTNAILSFVVWFNSSKQVVGNTDEIQYQQPMTIPTSVKYLRFILEPNAVVSGNITLSNIQFEKGSSATTLSPYQQLGTNSDIFVNGALTALNQANFGTYNDTQVTGFDDPIFTKKSFLGSIQVSGTWYILINIRHRNGKDDGINYGIQIMTPMTSMDIVQIRNHIGGTWSNWRNL